MSRKQMPIEMPKEGQIVSKFWSEGVILGNLWGSGQGIYPAPELNDFESREKLIEAAEERIRANTFQPHADFDGIKGAILIVHEVRHLFYHNQWWEKPGGSVIVRVGNMDQNEAAQLHHYFENEYL